MREQNKRMKRVLLARLSPRRMAQTLRMLANRAFQSRRWLGLRPPIPRSGAGAACDRAAYPVGPWLLHARAFRAGLREDAMTTTTFILLLNAFAQLLAAIAQLLAVLRRRRR
jgi:hypothetical protein